MVFTEDTFIGSVFFISYKKITSYPLDGCVPRCRKAEDRGRRQDGRTSVCDLGTEVAEKTRVSMRRNVTKESLEIEGVSRPPRCTNRTEKTIWALRNQTSSALLKQS